MSNRHGLVSDMTMSLSCVVSLPFYSQPPILPTKSSTSINSTNPSIHPQTTEQKRSFQAFYRDSFSFITLLDPSELPSFRAAIDQLQWAAVYPV